jgi:DNA-binding NarL/FixJ family response regulator
MMQPRDQLTAKEIRVATLVWEGLTNREIAKIIGATEQVVKNYLHTAFDKLGVWSRLELALYVANHGGASWASSPADIKPQAEAEPQAAGLAYAIR